MSAKMISSLFKLFQSESHAGKHRRAHAPDMTKFDKDIWSKQMPENGLGDKDAVRIAVNTKADKFVLILTKDKIGVVTPKNATLLASELTWTATYTWTPQTDLHDFEVCMDNGKEVTIGANDGIGVVVLEASATYVKLYRTKEGKVETRVFNWKHGKTEHKIIEDDMYLGYEILYLCGSKGQSATNLFHERESFAGEGTVFEPGLDKSLAKQPKTSERKDEKKRSTGEQKKKTTTMVDVDD